MERGGGREDREGRSERRDGNKLQEERMGGEVRMMYGKDEGLLPPAAVSRGHNTTPAAAQTTGLLLLHQQQQLAHNFHFPVPINTALLFYSCSYSIAPLSVRTLRKNQRSINQKVNSRSE